MIKNVKKFLSHLTFLLTLTPFTFVPTFISGQLHNVIQNLTICKLNATIIYFIFCEVSKHTQVLLILI